MATTDPIDILLAHDRWATGQLLDAMDRLTDEQLHRAFEMGMGSLHKNLVHMIGAVQTWGDVLAERPVRPWISDERRSVAQLRALHNEAADGLAAAARVQPLDQVLTRERNGQVFRYTRAAILVHVTTHNMHHRAQCLNMLRHCGVSPLPPSSAVEWSRAGEPAL